MSCGHFVVINSQGLGTNGLSEKLCTVLNCWMATKPKDNCIVLFIILYYQADRSSHKMARP